MPHKLQKIFVERKVKGQYSNQEISFSLEEPWRLDLVKYA